MPIFCDNELCEFHREVPEYAINRPLVIKQLRHIPKIMEAQEFHRHVKTDEFEISRTRYRTRTGEIRHFCGCCANVINLASEVEV